MTTLDQISYNIPLLVDYCIEKVDADVQKAIKDITDTVKKCENSKRLEF